MLWANGTSFKGVLIIYRGLSRGLCVSRDAFLVLFAFKAELDGFLYNILFKCVYSTLSDLLMSWEDVSAFAEEFAETILVIFDMPFP